MNYDNYLIKIFFNKNKRLSNNYWKFINRIKKLRYQNIQYYLLNRYNDLTENNKTIYKESLYRLLNNIEIRPVCKTCGKQTSFNYNKHECYNEHCSKSCEMKDHNVMNKHNQKCLDKYGSINNTKKYKQTCILKYGVDNPAKSEQIKEKTYKTNINKYGTKSPLQNSKVKEKTKFTCIERYGNEIPQKTDIIKNKIKKTNILTCIKKYNVTNVLKIKEINEKRIRTLLKNHSYPNSLQEDQSYKLLKEKYPDTIRQYKSKQYPFNCDFYIPSLDLYIECNYHWTHGFHYYNENNLDDQKKLNIWKSKNSNYYKNAILTWTKRDIEKRNIAKQNNLNFLVFFSTKDLIKWINESR